MNFPGTTVDQESQHVNQGLFQQVSYYSLIMIVWPNRFPTVISSLRIGLDVKIKCLSLSLYNYKILLKKFSIIETHPSCGFKKWKLKDWNLMSAVEFVRNALSGIRLVTSTSLIKVKSRWWNTLSGYCSTSWDCS